MSYSLSSEQASKSGAVEALEAALAAQREVVAPEVQEAYDDHAARILEAAAELLGTVGSDDATIKVVVSGHANPGHGKREGWADEFVSVAIHATEPVAAEPDPEGDSPG